MSIWLQRWLYYIHINPTSDMISYHLQNGHVALGIAAESGHVAMAERLLKAKANINHQAKVKMALFPHGFTCYVIKTEW